MDDLYDLPIDKKELSLRDMWSVATMIECDKNKVGFDV